MQLSFNGLARPKRAARNLKIAYDIKLAAAHMLIAKLAGYRDWHELERSGLSDAPRPLDVELHERARDQRRMRLIERLSQISQRSFMEAARGVLCAQLLHQNQEGPARSYRDDGSFYVGQTVFLDADSKGIVLDASRAVEVLDTQGGVALRGREEIRPAEADPKLGLPLRLLLAYGKWTESDGSIVLFARDYMPIWRIEPGGRIKPADPSEWIEYRAQSWFWNDRTRPWGRLERINEERERLVAFGVTDMPLSKWAILPLLFERRAKSTESAKDWFAKMRPWADAEIA